MKFKIEGVLAPVFTPMDEAGNVNYDVIPKYMDHLVRDNVKGILGLIKADYIVLHVISQVGGAPLPDVIELAKYSEEMKADAIMTLPELYYKPRSVDQLVAYLEVVSNAAPTLPLVYYHFPMMSGVDLNMKEFFSNAKRRIANFKGMKADLGVAVQVVEQLDSDQKVFIANHHLAPAALMGHDSSIATVTNMFAPIVSDIIKHVEAGDVIIARTKQTQLNKLVDAISSFGDFVPAMKAAMEEVTGVKVGPPRQPLTRLTHETISYLKQDLHRLGFGLKHHFDF